MPTASQQLELASLQNARVMPVPPKVKSAKTLKLFNVGVSGNPKTGKSADPSCYHSHVGSRFDRGGLFDKVENDMTKRNTSVCIKALRERGGIIEWNYDRPQQVIRMWKEICETGRAPDTGESLASACYFLGDKVEPHKYWERRRPVPVVDMRDRGLAGI